MGSAEVHVEVFACGVLLQALYAPIVIMSIEGFGSSWCDACGRWAEVLHDMLGGGLVDTMNCSSC